MCTLFVSWNTHAKFPLIVAANRDEFYERKTTRLHWWEEQPEILAGKDLEAGGTWMGINKQGRWGVITNYRKFPPEQTYKSSRGDLIKRFLGSDMDMPSFEDFLIQNKAEYDGYNLLYGDRERLFYYSNRHDELHAPKILKPGIYGLSNALLDTPWPKVQHGKKMFDDSISGDDINHDSLFALLSNEKKYTMDELPKTGLSEDMEILVSSIFISSQKYGTRTSTVLKMSEHSVELEERSHVETEIKKFELPITAT